jgi:hypothetical protein
MIFLRAGSVQHAAEKLSTRATTLLQTSSRSEVYTRNYSPAKLWKSNPWQFRTPIWESRDKKSFGCGPRGEVQSIL